MRDPKRLLEGDQRDLTVKLLRAWRSQQPPPRALAQTAAALGLGASLAATKAVGATAAGSAALAAGESIGTASASGGALSTASLVTKMVVLKYLAGGLVAGSAVAVTVTEVMHPGSPNAPAASSGVSTRAEGPARASHWRELERSNALPTEAAEAASTLGPAPGSSSAGAMGLVPPDRVGGLRVPGGVADPEPGSAANSPERPRDHSSLPEEVAAIEQARRAVAARHAREAFRALDQYRALRTSAALEPEDTLLRIEALELAGQRLEAVRLARRFIAQFPKSPHAARLRRLVANARQTAGPATR
jgi:hypothetical protein